MQPAIRRAEGVLREFEWTWTKAVVASVLLWFVALTFLAVVPSWWLYFSEETLGWRNTPERFWLFKARDVVAMGLYGVPFGIMLVVSFYVQKWRRRLRSESESRPTGGYR